MTACPTPLLVSLDCFSACKTTQELLVTQLARHIDLFHLVVTDNQRPDSLSLPHGLDPPIKHTLISAKLLPPDLGVVGGRQPCALVPNKSFLCTGGVVFIRQYLKPCILFFEGKLSKTMQAKSHDTVRDPK
jgi:hypothetical protein